MYGFGTIKLIGFVYIKSALTDNNMGLFSTLLATSSGKYNPSDEGLATVTTTASSLSLPTIIQMFTDKPFELDLSPTRSQIPSYANLSYQAVPVNPTADPASSNAEPSAGLRKQQNPLLSTVPELGIWNCRVNVPHLSPNPSSGTTGAATLVDSLLDIPVKSCKTARAFCFKVDVSRPEMVEPTLTALQEALVRYLIQSQDYSSTATSDVSTSSTATTTLYQLRMVQFGLATGEDKNDSIKAAPEERDRAVKLTLQIAVVWPKLTGVVPDNDSYRNQQTMALLYYHLRRYAAALNASLLFVRPVTSTTAEEGMGGSVTEPSTMDLLQPTINIAQLGAIWRALVQGKAVWNSEVWSEVLELSLRTPVTPQVENEEEVLSVITVIRLLPSCTVPMPMRRIG